MNAKFQMMSTAAVELAIASAAPVHVDHST